MSKIIASDAAFECELKDEVAIVRLKKNAMKIVTDTQTRDKYINLLDKLEVDLHVTGLIQINDGAFAGEAELKKLMKRIIEDTTMEKVISYRFTNWISQIVRRRLYFQKPIVAGVAGPITMEELGTHLISDRLIVSDHFSIRNPSLQMGMPPGPLLTLLLPRLLGPRKALKLLTDDDIINAPETLDLGLVDNIVPQAQFEQECMAEMRQLVRLPASLVSETRELIFPKFDRFQEHLDRSIRQRTQFIHTARRR